MKIVFFEIHDWEKDFIQQELKGDELIFTEDPLTKDNITLASDADIISIFIYSNIDKTVLKHCKNLKAIVTRSTGFDHINIKECRKKKIKILNVPSYGENTVAEHTFALILALSRKINTSWERTKRGNFSVEDLKGFDLKGKTIGIIGYGNIGRHVARMAKGFEMNTLVNTPKREKKRGIQFTSLDTLLKRSDIITLHCPYNKKTRYLLNGKNIPLIKKGAFIINTARGGLINTKALIKALAQKKLGGAALDVLEEEGLIKEEIQLLSKKYPKEHLENLLENHILLTFDNVIITPHNAFNSTEALQRILEVSVQNISCVLNKKTCKNLVK